ncbi:hypothetical protein F2P81_006027 [Scophthalmus maximus]|uniref:Uncharacterized protein n=1 Tax=Scophthalmus maximus TaxID=52904 RepID=A0A6A4TBA9_SCOMX|nr:hypothetical protein F2P81_006027 [Scophthalmus maximus]
MQQSMEAISLRHCCDVSDAQVASMAASSSSERCGLVILVCLFTIKHSDVTDKKPVGSTFGSVGRCRVLLEKEIGVFTKLVGRREHEVSPKSPGRRLLRLWTFTLKNTVDQHQQMST